MVSGCRLKKTAMLGAFKCKGGADWVEGDIWQSKHSGWGEPCGKIGVYSILSLDLTKASNFSPVCHVASIVGKMTDLR